MRLTTALLICSTLFAIGCSREEEKDRLKQSIAEVEARLAEGKAEARKALAVAKERWEELRPEAEKAVDSIEDRVEKLVGDKEALKRLPPEAIERVREHIRAMRQKLAEAKAAYEQGDADLAVEKADDVQQEREVVEELLVERPESST